jgi:hypothetical protein
MLHPVQRALAHPHHIQAGLEKPHVDVHGGGGDWACQYHAAGGVVNFICFIYMSKN